MLHLCVLDIDTRVLDIDTQRRTPCLWHLYATLIQALSKLSGAQPYSDHSDLSLCKHGRNSNSCIDFGIERVYEKRRKTSENHNLNAVLNLAQKQVCPYKPYVFTLIIIIPLLCLWNTPANPHTHTIQQKHPLLPIPFSRLAEHGPLMYERKGKSTLLKLPQCSTARRKNLWQIEADMAGEPASGKNGHVLSLGTSEQIKAGLERDRIGKMYRKINLAKRRTLVVLA